MIAAHPVAPIYVQRAVFIAVLSFLFFLGMMLAFYLRQSLGYFLLATAFLFVYLATMFSWFTMRKRFVRVFENGFEFKNARHLWSEVDAISSSLPVLITLKTGKSIELPSTIAELDLLVRQLRSRVAQSSAT
jgi:hypothetical protein